MEELAFVAFDARRVLVLAGPFRRRAAPPRGRPALYAPDFFRTDPRPWWEPRRAWWSTRGELRRRLPAGEGPPPAWGPSPRARYRRLFAAARAALGAGVLEKVVPVVAWEGRWAGSPWTLCRRALAARGGRAYGLVTPREAWVGVSPELLFARGADGAVATMALAGTAPPGQGDRLLRDRKERQEHRLVVDFLREALRRFGQVRVGPTRPRRFPGLVHLYTPLRLVPTAPPSFVALVRALHPTPALGGVPQGASLAWLRRRTAGRGRFGAPFGVVADGEQLCLVAIRNARWRPGRLRVFVGGGVLRASRFAHEWAELERKFRAVQELLGL